MKLFGNSMSTCTRKALFTLHETATPFELVVLDFMKGDHKSPEHLTRQPFGQMPALDDGFMLYESRAMARYIDDKAGRKLTPTDPQHWALMEQWISVETSNFTPHAMKFIYQSVFKREQTPETLAKAGEGLDVACSVLDKNLADKTYLLGDQFTLADIMYAPYLEYGMLTDAKDRILAHANVAAWWNRVSERPAWKKTVGR
ncbi:MAG: glutathione S-transferase N-terminal domain-containing protein [Deltaproteobacteria bacterium]|nr:glutathione S-transferase N-terminal domain-containing protein [Deltaproteobacteria bacterium]